MKAESAAADGYPSSSLRQSETPLLPDLAELCSELERAYRERDFNEEVIEKGLTLIVECFAAYRAEPATNMSVDVLKALCVGAEVCDYGNVLDGNIGTERKHPPGTVYSWLCYQSEALLGALLLLWGEQTTTDLYELKRALYRARFCAATSINEDYRKGHYAKALKSLEEIDTRIIRPIPELAKIATRRRHRGAPAEAEREYDALMLEVEDARSLIYFIAAKAARNNAEFIRGEEYLTRATTALLRGALSLTNPGRSGGGADMSRPHFLIRRVGVTHVARAWTALAWGRVTEAGQSSQLALEVLAPNDFMNHYLAKSISGIATRIKAGKNNREKLDKAINDLEESYRFFSHGEIKALEKSARAARARKMRPTPRYAVRTLFELCLALIIGDKLDRAVELLEEIVDRTSEDRFSKLMQNPRWQSQLHGLYSRIARHDLDGKYSPIIARRLGRAWSAPKGVERREALKLAVYAADVGLRIAEQNHLRGAELDSLVCLGEARFAAGEIDNAAESFALGIEKNFGRRGLEGGPDINPDQRACCLLYLARIAIARFDYDGARQHLDAYKLMLPLEHEWVNDLSKEVEAEFEERLENKLIIEFNKDWSYKEFEQAFIRGLATKLNLRHRRVADLEHKLQLSRPTIYRLRQSLADDGESTAGKKKTKRQRGGKKESGT